VDSKGWIYRKKILKMAKEQMKLYVSE